MGAEEFFAKPPNFDILAEALHRATEQNTNRGLARPEARQP